MIVIDASVAVKWFIEEQNSAPAQRLLDEQKGELVVPDVFIIEVAATLVRIANVNKANRSESQDSLFRLINLIEGGAVMRSETLPEHTIAAANLAIDIGHPLKDCIYLILAMALDCELVTADARFAAKARAVWRKISVLGT